MNRVTATRIVRADIDTVWALVADVTTVVRYHSRVKSVDLLSPEPTGLDAARRCNFEDGTSVVETITAVREGRYVELAMSEFSLPMSDFSAQIELTPAASGGTQLTFTLAYEMKYGVLGSLMNVLMVRGQMSGLMNTVLAGIDHHLQTGQTVGPDFAAAA